MTSSAPTIPAVPDLVFTDHERLALAGFLAGYRGLTREPTRSTFGSSFRSASELAQAVLGTPCRHRALRSGA